MKPRIIVPISIELDWPEVETTAAEIREQYEKFGITEYLLACPSGGWRGNGYPPASHWDDRARYFADVRRTLNCKDIRLGWWITTTLRCGILEGATPATKADGTRSPMASCPLDPVFRQRFSEDVARFAAIAKPDFIMTEDDLSINAGTDRMGCFCEHHLAEFSRRQGKTYTRESLVAALTDGTPESVKLEWAWRELKKDSLVSLAEQMRRALDEKTPEIPMGYMQPGSTYWENNTAYAVAKAMAGPRHRPFSRIFGTFYSGAVGREIPSKLYRCLWFRQHTPEDFGFIHESDTYPHTRYFSSGAAMNTIMAAAYSMGFEGSTFQTQQLLDDPNEESEVYGGMLRRERPRFQTLIDVASQCRVYGAQVPFDPFWNNQNIDQACIPRWPTVLGRMGIPCTTTESTVAFWDKNRARYATDGEVKAALSGGLILEGAAAKTLCDRGYGKYLGVSVGDDVATGALGLDLAAREIIREPFLYGGKGRNMPTAHMYAPGGNGQLLRLTVTDDACEVITEEVDFRKRLVCPAMTRFQNSLGGRVVVMGETIDKNRSQSLYNYRRQRLLQNLALWCGGDFAMAMGAPDVFVIENRPKEENADFHGMLTLLNFCDDTPESVTLHLPEAWRGGAVCIMDGAGSWQPAKYERTADGIRLLDPVAHYSPVYLLIRK